ncbi:portal protein [bacterium]|nr:portal protein [bacterium]
MSNDKARARVNEVKAEWNEETTIDEVSGEVVVNGNPKFSFTKTYFFPKRDNGEMTVEEMASEGYDMSDITPLKYFWRRFILDTKIPPNRFNLDITGDTAHPLNNDDSAITREEYAFNRFITRIRNIYREILLKPVWVQICIMMPELANSELLKQFIGITYNEENTFVQAKERSVLTQGANIISTLS